ncbi:hypothetical protein DY000_02059655 [Brassica cretica]|uniref:Uncharacterized protein n=1 Tax=Brassica cretica TaxID=69181 RepID=A0ABQ7ATG7_BRACR|nr:hypothetical protein DY000_02059655 [Brassica cretica]
MNRSTLALNLSRFTLALNLMMMMNCLDYKTHIYRFVLDSETRGVLSSSVRSHLLIRRFSCVSISPHDFRCVPSKSTATIKLELLPLTDGIITLDTLQIHVKEKGSRYIPEQLLKINSTPSRVTIKH